MDTQYGFEWGPMSVTRVASDDRLGFVLLVEAGGKHMQIRCTPTGRNLSAHMTTAVGHTAGDGDPRPKWIKEKN